MGQLNSDHHRHELMINMQFLLWFRSRNRKLIGYFRHRDGQQHKVQNPKNSISEFGYKFRLNWAFGVAAHLLFGRKELKK